jgi:hypothetical protein
MSREISYLKRRRDSSINIVTAYEVDDGDWISGGGREFPFSTTARQVLWGIHFL